jgi:co-chaperonin GroES (HSP10)
MIAVGRIAAAMVAVDSRNLDEIQQIKEASFHQGSRVIWGKNNGHSVQLGRTMYPITRSLIL